MKGSSSLTAKGTLARRFRAKVVESHGLKWFQAQKEAKYASENWIDESLLTLEFPTICDKIHELGLGYVFVEPEECNLTLVRKFYANRDNFFVESIKVKIRDQLALALVVIPYGSSSVID
ncbi:hypothetical protein HAX54_040504 [Datura stramonium]|uniref:Uncharacterized protein n=1 Tax=Datura stramonium TaxID=4076 RepID=A0ABS8SK41_DATST|nr:hypothetical protein [Datura stramonium]